MQRSRLAPPALATAALLALAACAGGGGGAAGAARTPAPPTTADADRLEAIYQARLDSALMDVHPADVAFMRGMIHHHAQALVMSALAPTHDASPTLRTLASRITNGQRDEIRRMRGWLSDRGLPAPEVTSTGEVTPAAGLGGQDMRMPGMLTPEQMDRLRAARGPAFDRLYLEYMIQHHQGAVTMVHDLFAADGAAQDDAVFKLASDVQVDQRSEIARMQRMLDAMRP